MTEPDEPGQKDGNPLEAALRTWGQRQRAAAGPPPAPRSVRTGANRTGRRWAVPAAAAAAVVVVLAAVGGGAGLLSRGRHPAGHSAAPPPPVAVATAAAAAARPFVRDAAVTAALLLGGGTLRLDPPTSTGAVDGQRALSLWRSGTNGVGGTTVVADVVVARADITLTVGVTAPGLVPGSVRPARPAVFEHRTGWVVFSDGGVFSCPPAPVASTSPFASSPPTGAPVLPVWLLSADGTVDYTTAGVAPCGSRAPASTAAASGITTVVVAGHDSAANRTCTVISGAADTTIYAFTLLAPPPCTGGNLGDRNRPGALAVARADSPDGRGLTFYDGRTQHAA